MFVIVFIFFSSVILQQLKGHFPKLTSQRFLFLRHQRKIRWNQVQRDLKNGNYFIDQRRVTYLPPYLYGALEFLARLKPIATF